MTLYPRNLENLEYQIMFPSTNIVYCSPMNISIEELDIKVNGTSYPSGISLKNISQPVHIA